MAEAAPACRAALDQATARWPKRNRASDGILGDPAHAARKSDHNSGNAWDLTHDPAHGVDCHVLADWIVERARAGREPRAKYVIWDRRIASDEHGWRWRPYAGANPHTKHIHVSIHASRRGDASPWFPPVKPPPDHVTDEEPDDMTPAQAKQLAEVHAMLTALVRPRRGDKKDHDPGAIDLGDILTNVEEDNK